MLTVPSLVTLNALHGAGLVAGVGHDVVVVEDRVPSIATLNARAPGRGAV